MFLILSLTAGLIFYTVLRRYRTCEIKNKDVLIIGGSSGLGLALAKILRKGGNTITITSRSIERLRLLRKKWGFEIKVMDVGGLGETSERETTYDYIFCCAGVSYPSYFTDQPLEMFERTINTNYLGTVSALKHYSVVNKKPFRFIMIGSTLSLFTFPGFSSYSPSKSALLSFFYTVYDEMKKLGIILHFYNTASIKTPEYKRENETKPSYTKSIDDMASPSSAEERASLLLTNMMRRRVVTSDIFTYLFQIKMDCECIIDYILFPIAVVVVFISKTYVKWKFRMT